MNDGWLGENVRMCVTAPTPTPHTHTGWRDWRTKSYGQGVQKYRMSVMSIVALLVISQLGQLHPVHYLNDSFLM